MGFWNDIFGQREQTSKVNVVADPYKDVRDQINQFLTSGLGGANAKNSSTPTDYPGQLVAPMSKQEQESLGYLDEYNRGQPSRTFQLGQDEINKTLSGDYDPTKSPMYQAVKAEAARNLDETQKNIASNSAGAGRYWSGARLSEQSDASTEQANQMNILAGELSDRERQRRLDVLPQAANYAQTEEERPLRKATASQTLGQLPRAIDQAMNEAKYKDWLRVNVDQPMDLAQLGATVQQAPLYGEVGYKPSVFNEVLSTAKKLKDLFGGSKKSGSGEGDLSPETIAKMLSKGMG